MDIALSMRSDAAKRFVALDSWRGICALFVASMHFTAYSHVYLLAFTQNSWIFVDFFFVLSGFVISHTYQDRVRDRRELASFALRRFGRIWPLHVAMLVPLGLLELSKLYLTHHGYSAERAPFTGDMSLRLLATNIALLQCIPPFGPPGWNGPSWSISVEYWTYIGFALIIIAFSSRHGLARGRSLWMFALVIVATSAILAFWPRSISVVYPFGFARCACSFAVGHFACRWWKQAQPSRLLTAGLIEIALVVSVIGFVSFAADTPVQFAAPLLFGIVVATFAGERGVVSHFLKTRPFVFLGRLSYSIYMVHWTLRALFQRVVAIWAQHSGHNLTAIQSFDGQSQNVAVIDGPWGGDLLLIGFLGLVVFASVFTFRHIERPGQAASKRLAVRLLSGSERRQAPSVEPIPL